MLGLMKKLLLEDVGADDWRAIEQECLKPNQFRSLILQERDLFAVKNKYASQYKTLKQLMLVNLSGIQEVVATVKQQVDYESSTFISSEEGRIKEWMEQHHFETVYIRYKAEELEKTRLEIGIMKVPLTTIREEIVPGIETLLDTSFVLDSVTPIPYEPYWRLTLTSVHHIQVMYGVGQLSKESSCCGDSYLHFKRNNDIYFAISDGMGTGERARQESQLTLSLFQTMLESGMKPGKAIQSVNSLLRIKNRKDSYATLDVISVNTKTGKGCFIKTGAPPSLLLRRKDCIVIDHNALPVGIVDDIEAYDYVIDLEPGDILLMFSDGFSESRQREVMEKMPEWDGMMPQQKVKEILAFYQEEEINDDVTLFILEITK